MIPPRLRFRFDKDVLRICYLIVLLQLCFADANQQCDKIDHFTCHNGHCIATSLLCDNNDDCGDNSDEKTCIHIHNAGDKCEEYTCADGFCIPKHWVCDGKEDCLDGSDESSNCKSSECTDGFTCDNNTCLPKEWVCDGSDDCQDKSDEANCAKIPLDQGNCNESSHHYLCHDRKRCLDFSDVCNNHSDCIDGSDEGGLCTTKDSCATSQCQPGKICQVTPRQILCTCPKGMVDDGQGKCIDVNECLTFGVCTQKCTNRIGGYSCSCIEGYTLMADNKTCKSSRGEGLLTFSLENEIRAYFVESTVYYPVVTNLSLASGVAYDGHHIYWTQVRDGHEGIFMTDEVGSSITELVNFGLGVPENIAVDIITGNIYFSDSFFKHIGVCDKTGDHCSILHTDGVDNPRAIALDSRKGWMYWSDWGEHHCIAKSAMDGSQRTVFISEDIYWPNGLAIDHGTDRLYWSDASKKRIECIKLDGTDRKIIVTESVQHPFSIAVYENSLYWSDWKGRQVMSCDKFTGKNMKVIARKANSQVYGVHVFNPSIESINVPNPCARQSSQCSHLCLISPPVASSKSSELSSSCLCPVNFEIGSDSKSCEETTIFDTVFIGISHSILELHHTLIGKKKLDEIPLNSISVLGDLAYNPLRDSIIFSDLHRHQIHAMERKSRRLSTIYESNDDFISEMEFDSIGNNIYWIDKQQNSVKVISLNRNVKITLINNFGGDRASDIALAPELGLMFISLHNTSRSHIDKFSMDGSKRFHFIEKGLIGPHIALTYDHELERLFWADQGAGHIMSCDINYPDSHLVVEHLAGPISVTVSHGNVFWVNFGSDKVYWTNIYTSATSFRTTSLGKTGIDVIKLISVKYEDHHNNTVCEDNGDCSHVCLLTPNGKSCGCPPGQKLDTSGLQCATELVCGKSQFKCNSGKCISLSNLCDDFTDCDNGEDESDCHKHEVSKECQPSQFDCHDKSYCVDKKHVCDAIEDCLDGSDEKHCDLPEMGRKCDEGSEFHCETGQCISMAFRCDGRIDCEDHSDEKDCKSNMCIEGEQFKCNSGACIPLSWECDGELDCPDSSDEHKDCKSSFACSTNHITCMNHKCVDKSLGCNGWDDCGDNSDEINCPLDHTTVAPSDSVTVSEQSSLIMCDRDSFKCTQSGKCIPVNARCNGTAECANQLDEKNCGECLYSHFECEAIKECIPESWVCDGMPDCVDLSDEYSERCNKAKVDKEAAPSTPPCSGILCRDSKKCIPLSKVCNNVYDCEDKSDEGGLCESTCEFAGCSHFCDATPNGAVCTCPSGFSLNADGRSCEDINECLDSKTCSHFCQNTVGSFRCYCHEPFYQLRDDRKRCKATGPEMEYLYLVENELRSMTESQSQVSVLYKSKDPMNVKGISYSSNSNTIYWDSMDGSLSALDLNTRKLITMDAQLLKPGKITVDWVSENIYVVENNNKIKICHFGARGCSTLYTGDLDVEITSVAVDPLEGLLFWSEKYNHMNSLLKSSIKRSTLAGRNINTVVENDLQYVTDITLDTIKKEVYWSDGLLKQVGKCMYNGNKLEILFLLMDPPISLELFEDHVYLSSRRIKYQNNSKGDKAGLIEKCSAHASTFGDCSYVSLLPSGSVKDIKIMLIKHPSKQLGGNDECSSVNCTGICINSNNKPLCICENGTFALNGEVCTEMLLEVEDSSKRGKSDSHIGTIFLAIFFIGLVIGALVVGYMKDIITIEKLQFGKLKDISIQFNNPGFELGSPLVKEKMGNHDLLQPGNHQYENPVIFRTFDSGPENC